MGKNCKDPTLKDPSSYQKMKSQQCKKVDGLNEKFEDEIRKLKECHEGVVAELKQAMEKERLEKERAWRELHSLRADWKFWVERGVEERLNALNFVGALEQPVSKTSRTETPSVEPPKNAAERLAAVRARVIARQGPSFK